MKRCRNVVRVRSRAPERFRGTELEWGSMCVLVAVDNGVLVEARLQVVVVGRGRVLLLSAVRAKRSCLSSCRLLFWFFLSGRAGSALILSVMHQARALARHRTPAWPSTPAARPYTKYFSQIRRRCTKPCAWFFHSLPPRPRPTDHALSVVFFRRHLFTIFIFGRVVRRHGEHIRSVNDGHLRILCIQPRAHTLTLITLGLPFNYLLSAGGAPHQQKHHVDLTFRTRTLVAVLTL